MKSWLCLGTSAMYREQLKEKRFLTANGENISRTDPSFAHIFSRDSSLKMRDDKQEYHAD